MTLPFSQQVTADATCRLLQAGSGFAAHIAVGSVLTGQVWGAVAGTAGTIAMEALGRASGCYNNPDDAPGFEPLPSYQGCKKGVPGCTIFIRISRANGEVVGNQSQAYEIYDVWKAPVPWGGSQATWVRYLDIYTNKEETYFREEPDVLSFPTNNCECEVPFPGPQYPDHQPGDPIAPPFEYTDPETGCQWQIQATDSYINSAGQPVFFWKATSNDPANCGGPYQWWGNGQEPNVPSFEDPRGPDVPPRPPTLPPGPGQDIKDDLDKIKEELEKLKECACPENPVQEGDYRTISFRSDETSPYGKSRLRKRFKYRSQSGLDLGAVVDHWRDFTWQAGPITVSHFGSALGAPQVWAASIDEGKRVIRHAGGEAGIDPDQVGKWAIGGSDNARYGVSDTMRVDTTGGYYWITARDGSNGRPIVARV